MADLVFVRGDGGAVRSARPGDPGGGEAVSAVNARRPGARGRPGRVPGGGPAVPGAVLMTTRGGRLFVADAGGRAGRRSTGRSATTCTGWSPAPGSTRGRARHLPADRGRPGRRADLGRLRPQRAGVLRGLDPVPLPVPAGAEPPVAVAGLRRGGRRTWPGTPRSASSPTPTGSRTRASRRWATWCRWPAWRCRTSSRRRSASRWRSRWSAGSPAARPAQLGNFWVDLIRIVLRVLLPIAVVGAHRVHGRPGWCRTSPAAPT